MMKRTAALLLAFILPAEAGAEPLFRRWGSLGWSFDDISLQSPGGARRRSQWSQAYDLSVEGPLVVPLAGELETNASFKDGFSLSQAVNTESPGQKTVTWSSRADLFPLRLRRYARFAPSYSWSQTEQAAVASAPGRVIRQDAVGFSGGFSLPRLPSVNVARYTADRADPLSGGPVRDRTETSRESVSWSGGPFRINLDRDGSRIQDLTGVQPARETETRRGDLELRTGRKEALGLQFFSLRSSAFAQKVQGATLQEDVTANLAARSLPFKRRGWSHELSYNNDFARANLSGAQSDASALSLLSNRAAGWGTVTSALNAGLQHEGGASRGLGETLSLSESLLKGRLTLAQSLSGGWSEGAGRATTHSDGGSLRATLAPRPGRAVTAELETSGSERLGGGGGSRTQKASLFGDAVLRGFRNSLRWDRVRQSVTAEGLVSVTDSVTASAEGTLRPGLSASLLAAYSRSRANRGAPIESPSGSLSLEWLPLLGLRFSARVSAAGSAANLHAGASWSAGRTTLSLYLERREISTPRSFSHLGVSLRRTF